MRGFQWLGPLVFSIELSPGCRDTCLAEFKTGEPGPEVLKTADGVILLLTAVVEQLTRREGTRQRRAEPGKQCATAKDQLFVERDVTI